MTVIDVTEATWEREVIERSRALAVVVDFWAEWCGPCRALGPVLEKAAAAREGDIVLAKLDTDANARISQAFAIQSIPAVKAFRDGAVAAEFVGAQPPAVVERFFDALVPSEADRLVASGEEAALERAVELEPSRADAAVPLARLLLARGDLERAESVLARVVGSFQADGLLARLRLERSGELFEALDALDTGASERAYDLLLEALDGPARDDVRLLIVGELDARGPGDELARAVRRRLALALF